MLMRCDFSSEAMQARSIIVAELRARQQCDDTRRKTLARRSGNLHAQVRESLTELNAVRVAHGLAPLDQQQRAYSLSLGRLV
jgi:hypothetical protein